jgi:hypothetical protein
MLLLVFTLVEVLVLTLLLLFVFVLVLFTVESLVFVLVEVLFVFTVVVSWATPFPYIITKSTANAVFLPIVIVFYLSYFFVLVICPLIFMF